MIAGGMHAEALAAAAYAVVLILLAAGLEWVARHAVWQARRYHAAGFRYHRVLDVWECPQGEHLRPSAMDDRARVIRYRARPHVCNACPVKVGCTDSDDGRGIEQDLRPVAEDGDRSVPPRDVPGLARTCRDDRADRAPSTSHTGGRDHAGNANGHRGYPWRPALFCTAHRLRVLRRRSVLPSSGGGTQPQAFRMTRWSRAAKDAASLARELRETLRLRPITQISFILRSPGCCGRPSDSSCGGSFAIIDGPTLGARRRRSLITRAASHSRNAPAPFEHQRLGYRRRHPPVG